MKEFFDIVKELEKVAKSNLEIVSTRVDWIIDSKCRSVSLIEVTLDSLLDLAYVRVGVEEFKKLNSYYSTVNLEYSKRYDEYYSEIFK